MNTVRMRAVLGVTLISCMVLANAQDQPNALPSPVKPTATGQYVGEPPCGPPPEAYKACEGKTAGSRSEFVSPRGDTIAGVCQHDGNGRIVLRPDHPPGGQVNGHRGPPPEAYLACQGKTVGNVAQFAGPNGETIQGTCETDGESLVLRPYHPPVSKGIE